MKKNIPLFIGIAAVIIIGVSAITIFLLKKTTSETSKPTLKEQISSVTNQYQKGQISREEANKQFCTLTARSQEEQQKAIESIRNYTNKPDLVVEYKCNNFSPNKPTAKPTEETYLAEGTYYFVDIATNQVIRTQQN